MSDLNSGKDKSEYEDVLCVNDSWGYPLRGIALYKSEPYAFDCIFDEELDDWSNIYFLTPISEEILCLSLENWNIWLRWMNNSSNVPHPVFYKESRATKTIEEVKREYNGQVSQKDWEDAEKYLNNEKVIEPSLKTNENSIKAMGIFKHVDDHCWGYEDRMPKLVNWTIQK